MHSSLSRRGRIRAVSFFAAVLVLSIGTAVSQHVQRIQLQRAVTNSYLHAFSEVTASLDKMDAAGKTVAELCSKTGRAVMKSIKEKGFIFI